MVIEALLVFQFVATALGGAILWRRHQGLRTEVLSLREEIRAIEARAATVQRNRKRVLVGEATPASEAITVPEAPLERARKRWRLPARAGADNPIRSNTAAFRGAALAIAGAAPAFGLFFGVSPEIAIASGLFIASGLVLTALRAEWSQAASAGLGFALLWCGLGLGLTAGVGAATILALPLATLAGAALLLARQRSGWVSLAVASIASATMLTLAWQTSFISVIGLAFAITALSAAVVGAGSLRREALFVGAFIATLAGLFGLSGQPIAAIWFTPAVALQGALFVAIAAVRVPQLGARGSLIAGLATLGSLGSALALHASRHGLADSIAASGVFAAIGMALAGIVALAARRHDRGHKPLKLTLWVLALGALAASAAAIGLAAPAPLAATAMSLLALAAVTLDRYWPAAAWRACALLALALALFHAASATRLMLGETPHWGALALLGFGVAAPAASAALTAHLARRNERVLTAGIAEATFMVLCLAAASLAWRLACAGGALMLTPIGFVEAGGHLALWLGLALACGVLGDASALRAAAAYVIGAMAAIGLTLAGLMWLGDYWTVRDTANGLLSYEPLGFLAPSVVAFAHWMFWRARDRTLATRIAFGMFVASAAGFAALATLRLDEVSETLRALICAGVVGGAIAVNFAPGITMAAAPIRRSRRIRTPHQA